MMGRHGENPMRYGVGLFWPLTGPMGLSWPLVRPIAFMVATALAAGCAPESTRTLTPITPTAGDLPNPTASTPAPSGTVGRTSQATVNVELRGLEQLHFADGASIRIERFIVRFAGVSLLRDVADPAASRIELGGNPVIITPGGTPAIGRDLNPGDGTFNGVRIQLGPSRPGASPNDEASNTLFVRGVYSAPDPVSDKADRGGISPNPAPIQPGSNGMGSGQQRLSSAVTTIPFTFTSRRSEGLLVGLDALTNAHDVVLVFPANRWFGNMFRNFFSREVVTRRRLGMSSDVIVPLVGEGLLSTDSATESVGEALENAILDSIGVEVH